MKTILDWLHEIEDDEVRAKALANYDQKYVDSHGVLKTERLSSALGKAFYWHNSPELFMYWFRAYDSIWKKENGIKTTNN